MPMPLSVQKDKEFDRIKRLWATVLEETLKDYFNAPPGSRRYKDAVAWISGTELEYICQFLEPRITADQIRKRCML